MGLRELLILLLGLAIVAVILRGLYVALRARRGQIRLAIDKNIPQDIDLEALELAELPGGGARVVRRADEEQGEPMPAEDAITQANSRAESLQLGREDQPVPVLMDTVHVGHGEELKGEIGEIDNFNEDDEEIFEPEDLTADAVQHSEECAIEDSEAEESWLGEDSWRSEPRMPQIGESTGDISGAQVQESHFDGHEQNQELIDEEPDDVLFDYQANEAVVDDGMSSVQPDYPDDDWVDEAEERGVSSKIDESEYEESAYEESTYEETGPIDVDDQRLDAESRFAAAETEGRGIERNSETSVTEDHAANESGFEWGTPRDNPESPALAGAGRADSHSAAEVELDDNQWAAGHSESQADSDAVPDELAAFSMTAGERIGGNPDYQEPGQANLFGGSEGETDSPPAKRTSLFSALRGRIRSQVANLREGREEEAKLSAQPQVFEDDFDVAAENRNPDAASLGSIPTEQLDIESSFEPDQGAHEAGEEAGHQIRATHREPKAIDETRAAPVFSRHDEAAIEEPVTEKTYAEKPGSTEPQNQSSSAQRSEVRQQEAVSQSSEVLVLNVMAREGREFRGEDLLHTVITAGLKFGDMQIFHHRFGQGTTGPVIFSLANILNPGTFDLNNMSQFTTIGVSLFMAMPTPINNLDAFEQMLSVAQQLCAALDGELKDDHRNVMTAQTIEHYRQRVRDFELRQLKTAGSRG